MSGSIIGRHTPKALKRSVRKWIRGWPYICDNECARRTMAALYEKNKLTHMKVCPYRIYFINPHGIDLAITSQYYNNKRLFDFSHDGDWDLAVLNISDMLIYRGLKQRFIEHRPWKDNALAPHNITSVDWPEPRQYLRFNEEQFHARACELDRLWDSLCSYGNLSCKKTEFSDLLNIAIDRNGRFLRLCSGLHRLVMSRLHGLDAVPCRVSIVHRRCRLQELSHLQLKL